MFLSGLYRSSVFTLGRYSNYSLGGSAAMNILDCSFRTKPATVGCYFVYLLVIHPLQRLSLFPWLLPSFKSFTLCHMRGFTTYKMNMALFFSSRMVYGGAVVSTVATCFLKASSHPCNCCSSLPRLRVPRCWFWELSGALPVWREVGATDHSHKHRTVIERNYPFLLFSMLPGKTGMKLKGQLTTVGKWEDNKQIWKTEDMVYLTKSWVRTILEQEIRVGVRDVTNYVAWKASKF